MLLVVYLRTDTLFSAKSALAFLLIKAFTTLYIRNISDLGWKILSLLIVPFKYILFRISSAMFSLLYRGVLFATSPEFHVLIHMKTVGKLPNVIDFSALHEF